jgi:hypothetical protein
MDPITMMAIGGGVSLLSGALSKPDKIDPNKIYSMMKSPLQDEMHQFSKDLIDPNSSMMKTQLGVLRKGAADMTADTLRATSRQYASSDEGGIMQAWMDKFKNQIIGNVVKSYEGLIASNIGKSSDMLSQVTNMDLANRTAMAQTYAGNVTNNNNWKSQMGQAGMNLGGSMMGTSMQNWSQPGSTWGNMHQWQT